MKEGENMEENKQLEAMARKLKNERSKAWARKNKDKIKEINKRYWLKKAKEKLAEEKKKEEEQIMEEVLNVKELTQYLRCSDSTVRKLIQNKEIPNFRIANRIYFKKALIDMWIQNQCMRSVEVMKNE